VFVWWDYFKFNHSPQYPVKSNKQKAIFQPGFKKLERFFILYGAKQISKKVTSRLNAKI